MKPISRFRDVVAAFCLLASLTLSFATPDLGAAPEAEPAKKPKPAESTDDASAKKEEPGEAKKAPAKSEDSAKKPGAKKPPPAKKEEGSDEKPDSDEEKKDEEDGEEEEKEPALHKVEKGDFELTVELDGIVEAAQSTAMSLIPEEWASLVVIEAIPHGTPVKKGDVLVRLETEDLAEQIADLKKAAPLAELNLKMARAQLAALEKTTPISLDDARRSKMEAEQDLAYYEDKGRQMAEDSARQGVKRLEQSLSYSREELKQLEKMYEADDLTEESEEIILQRTRNDVEYYEFNLAQSRERTERLLNTSIPRDHDSQRRNVENVSLAWRQAEQNLPDALKQKRLEVEAQERSREKSIDRLANLEKDLNALTVRAPHDGVAYYGASKRGKWITASTVGRKLMPAGKLMPREIFMTVVKTTPLRITAAVPENKLRHLEPGLAGEATLVWNDDAPLATKLTTVSYVPYEDGTFDAHFSLPKSGKDTPAMFPGMKAKLTLDAHSAEDVITVPRKAVHRGDKGERYVHLKNGNKRTVKVGKSDDKVTEILSGLKVGDEIKVP